MSPFDPNYRSQLERTADDRRAVKVAARIARQLGTHPNNGFRRTPLVLKGTPGQQPQQQEPADA